MVLGAERTYPETARGQETYLMARLLRDRAQGQDSMDSRTKPLQTDGQGPDPTVQSARRIQVQLIDSDILLNPLSKLLNPSRKLPSPVKAQVHDLLALRTLEPIPRIGSTRRVEE